MSFSKSTERLIAAILFVLVAAVGSFHSLNYFWCYNGHNYVVNARKICVIWLKATKNACKSTGKFCCLYQLILARIINVQSKTDSLVINAILWKKIFSATQDPWCTGLCLRSLTRWHGSVADIYNCSVLQTKVTVPCCQLLLLLLLLLLTMLLSLRSRLLL